MKNRWYGDPRDLVKWGAVMRIARENRATWIVQIAFLTEDRDMTRIEGSRETAEIERVVFSHFRDVRLIKKLGRKVGIPVHVFGAPFCHQERASYMSRAREAIRDARREGPGIVLLDPDTGLSANPRSEHVSPSEVTGFWRELLPGDWLVLYQHANRTKDWRTRRCQELSLALQGAQVETFASPNGARDVVFFAAEKPSRRARAGSRRDYGRREGAS